MLEKLRPYRWWILGLALLAVTGGGAAVAFASLKQADPRWSKKLLGKGGRHWPKLVLQDAQYG